MLQAVVGIAPDADDASAGEASAPGPGAGSGVDGNGRGDHAAGGIGGNGAEGGQQPGLGSASSGGRGLEALLLGKARRLEHELTMARLRISEACGEPSLAHRHQ